MKPASPFKGLAAFDDSELDALLFFGREREIEVIAANIQAARVTILYGPSGVGKSSVLRAGVAPRLRREPNVVVQIFDRWAGAVDAVRDAVAGRPDDSDLYLVLDQFEEYFLYHEDDGALPSLLARVIGDAGARVNVLIGIREDSLAQLDAFRRRLPTLLSNRLALDRLNRAAARDAIVRPVERYAELTGEDVTIEPELVERLLAEVATGRVDLAGAVRGVTNGDRSDRIEAPYLQLVLQTVWEAERADGSRTMRASTLERLGGAVHIVQEHLDDAMAGLSDDEKDAAAAMYNHLVTPSGTKIAHRVGDLARYASLPEQQASHVLEKLAHERIVRASSEDGPAAVHYEIFHDVLADAVLAWRARYEEQAALREAERRRRRALTIATAALGALVLVAAIAVYALVERGNSRAQARRAHAEALAAESLTQLGIDPSRSLQLAYEAARLRPGAQEETVLRTALLADRLRRVIRPGGKVAAVAWAARGKPVVAAGPLAVSRDGRHVARAATGGRLVVDGRDRAVRGTIGSIAFVASGARFVTASSKGITLWRTRDVKPLASIAISHRHALIKAAVSPDGREVVAQLRFRRADVYALPSGRHLFSLSHDGFIEDATYSPDGHFILTGGYAGDVGGVRLWDARSGRLVREYRGALLHVRDVTFSRDGKLIAAASADGTARVWETQTGTETAMMSGHQNQVTSVDFNPAGTALVSGSSDGTARVWGAGGGEAGRLLNVLAGHRSALVGAVFSPDGRSVLTGGDDGTARIWDPGSEPPFEIVHSSRRFSPRTTVRAGNLVAHGRPDGTVRVTDSGRVLWSRRLHTKTVSSVSFSADRTLLASASVDHDAIVWDVQTGRVVRRLRGHFGPVSDAEFSPDGRWVVTAGPITAGLWLVRSSAAPIFLAAPVTKPLSGAAFTGPDGRTVIAASRDGSVLRYRCDICGGVDALIALARRRLAAERSA